MVSSFHLTSVFRLTSMHIYNMYIIASMAFLIQSMLVGTGAGSLIRLPRQTVCLR